MGFPANFSRTEHLTPLSAPGPGRTRVSPSTPFSPVNVPLGSFHILFALFCFPASYSYYDLLSGVSKQAPNSSFLQLWVVTHQWVMKSTGVNHAKSPFRRQQQLNRKRSVCMLEKKTCFSSLVRVCSAPCTCVLTRHQVKCILFVSALRKRRF